MSAAMNVDDSNFEAEVTKSALPVMADFWASWCGPCKMIAPLIDKMAAEYSGRLKVVKVDVDSSSNTASAFGIRSIPTLMFFKSGEMVEQVIGVVNEQQLKKIIDKIIA
ncbi:MAG TPA: thioredoxin [Candidatus Goldiibacteriota bacterium]|nr:thioredoxin [Candidatus Goldiibacteriota bacterium]